MAAWSLGRSTAAALVRLKWDSGHDPKVKFKKGSIDFSCLTKLLKTDDKLLQEAPSHKLCILAVVSGRLKTHSSLRHRVQ